MLFRWIFTHAGLRTWYNKINQWLWAFGVPWSPGFVLGVPPRGGFWKQSKWPWIMIHSMSCRKPCRLYVHLAFTYILRWSLERSVKRTWTGSAFSANEGAWSVLVTGSHSRVWSGPQIPGEGIEPKTFMTNSERGELAATYRWTNWDFKTWSETTLNYGMMVKRYPNLKEEIGVSIPGCEISSLLDRKLAR